MADILLLEPAYKNKYPPLGLMKISYFHKYVCGDYVRFAKGKLPDALKDKKWDRVYVTTLFTFEWENTKKAIEYALSVVKDKNQVYTGGILATLMPELIAENFPTVKNNTGLLNKTGTLGLKGEECIDTMTPDYGILDDIADEYVYPAHDAYFTYMTRGCGMKCQFCAVQTLEPNYIPYLSIRENIRKIDEKFGPKKDLLLMDNNVLRSPDFDKIIDEIIDLGFGKGATYTNPKTGKQVQRFVDFNQGLDAYLLTPHKAKRLGELALRPARIAFDHIEDVDAYKRAITMCAENGITHMSNYLLYNGVDFTGKGHKYHADTPEDLYNRMLISMDLCEELNARLDHTTAIFSFPMRYIPLSDLKRGYVGAKWNAKYLRALQRMLIPTQGKGVSSRSFFEADFGKSADDFVKFLAMPEDHLGWRGHFVEKKDESAAERDYRKQIWNENNQYLDEWTAMFEKLGDSKETFISYIHDNDNSVERYLTIKDDLHKKLFLHYLTQPVLMRALNIDDDKEVQFIVNYISNEFPLMYERLVRYIRDGRLPYSLLEGIYKTYGKKFVMDVLEKLDFNTTTPPFVINNLLKVQAKTGIKTFNYELIKYAYLYFDAEIFTPAEKSDIIKAIKNLDESKTKKLLCDKLDVLKEKLVAKVSDEAVGVEFVVEQIQSLLCSMHEQLSMFEDEA